MTAASRVAVFNPGSSTLKASIVLDRDQVEREIHIDEWNGTVEGATRAEIDPCLDSGIDAFGVRVVHGGSEFTTATVVDERAQRQLEEIAPLAPLHQSRSLSILDHLRRHGEGRPVVACFDTQFHVTIPDSAATYALPAEWRSRWGLRRAGFHGLSHAWASRRALEITGQSRSPSRVVTAHLGAGASLCAVQDGTALDTTMGFTPLEGLVMATRSGSVDPGLLCWLLRHTELDADALAEGLERRSGLRGLAGDDDMRSILGRRRRGDEQAALAIDVYVHRLRQSIGAMVAVLGGIDALVFTGGVGEHAAEIRMEAVASLGHLGLAIDAAKNERADGDRDLSAEGASARTVLVRSGEDLEIARLVREVLQI